MKKKFREITVDGVKYGWTVNGGGGCDCEDNYKLVTIWLNKKPLYESLHTDDNEVTPKSIRYWILTKGEKTIEQLEKELFEVKHEHQKKPKEPDRLAAQTRMNDTWSKEKSRHSYTPKKTNTYWRRVWKKLTSTTNPISIVNGIAFLCGLVVATNKLPAVCPNTLLFGLLGIVGGSFFVVGIWNIFIENE